MSSSDSSNAPKAPIRRRFQVYTNPRPPRKRPEFTGGTYIYPPEEFNRAFLAWSRTPPGEERLRQERWDHYVEVRDGLPPGAATKMRLYNDIFLVEAALGLHDN